MEKENNIFIQNQTDEVDINADIKFVSERIAEEKEMEKTIPVPPEYETCKICKAKYPKEYARIYDFKCADCEKKLLEAKKESLKQSLYASALPCYVILLIVNIVTNLEIVLYTGLGWYVQLGFNCFLLVLFIYKNTINYVTDKVYFSKFPILIWILYILGITVAAVFLAYSAKKSLLILSLVLITLVIYYIKVFKKIEKEIAQFYASYYVDSALFKRKMEEYNKAYEAYISTADKAVFAIGEKEMKPNIQIKSEEKTEEDGGYIPEPPSEDGFLSPIK